MAARSAWRFLSRCLALLGIVSRCDDRTAPRGLPRFDFADLRAQAAPTPAIRKRLQQALRVEGAALLTNVPGLRDVAATALPAIGDCLAATRGRGPVARHLPGNVHRSTLATSTAASLPEPLPSWALQHCPEVAAVTASLRSTVALALTRCAARVDEVMAPDSKQAGPSLQDLLHRGTQLEHFHRYTAGAQALSPHDTEATFTMHTDLGVMQALIVTWRGDAAEDGFSMSNRASGLRVQLADGSISEADPAEHQEFSLLLLFGEGASAWLPALGIRPSPHMVDLHGMSSRDERLVYGVMVLPPDDWTVTESTQYHGTTTFGEWQRRVFDNFADSNASSSRDVLEYADPASVGCLSASSVRRRLEDQAQSCGAGKVYCGMQCQPSSDLSCSAEEVICFSGTLGQVCPVTATKHDPSCTLTCPMASTALRVRGSGEDELGQEDGVVNGLYKLYAPKVYRKAHGGWLRWNPSLKQWQIHVDRFKNGSVLYYSDGHTTQLPPETGWFVWQGSWPPPNLKFLTGSPLEQQQVTQDAFGNGFCNGLLTDMHMTGFVTSSEVHPCLILLFPGWVLSDAARFWVACVGVVFAGILAEALVAVRRWHSSAMPHRKQPGWVHNAQKVILYAVARSMGYFVMLVTMTYSVELFVAVIAGLSIGYMVFNMDRPVGADLTACCQAGSSPPLQRFDFDQDSAGRRRLQLCIQGLTCESCVATVRNTIAALDGIQLGKGPELHEGVLEIFVPDVGPKQIVDYSKQVCEALESAGFCARVLEETRLEVELAESCLPTSKASPVVPEVRDF